MRGGCGMGMGIFLFGVVFKVFGGHEGFQAREHTLDATDDLGRWTTLDRARLRS